MLADVTCRYSPGWPHRGPAEAERDRYRLWDVATCTRVSFHLSVTEPLYLPPPNTHTLTHSHALSSLCLPIEEARVQVSWHLTLQQDPATTIDMCVPQIARQADSLTLCPGTWFGLLSSPWIVSSVSIHGPVVLCMHIIIVGQWWETLSYISGQSVFSFLRVSMYQLSVIWVDV